MTDDKIAFVDAGIRKAKALLGQRVEIPVHYDLWMRGARFGVVSSIGKDGEFVRVKLDHPQVRNRLKVWRIDYDYMRRL